MKKSNLHFPSVPTIQTVFLVATPLKFTPKLFWRCPCCGHPFPYYVLKRGGNDLKEKECFFTIKGQHIKYAKLKFCPLIIPSVCPECKCKFFEMTGDELNILTQNPVQNNHRNEQYHRTNTRSGKASPLYHECCFHKWKSRPSRERTWEADWIPEWVCIQLKRDSIGCLRQLT